MQGKGEKDNEVEKDIEGGVEERMRSRRKEGCRGGGGVNDEGLKVARRGM